MDINQMFNLDGKVAVVTGGNGGIGKGIAEGLAAAGASIVIAARNEQKSDSTVRELKALGADAMSIPTDVTSQEGIDDLATNTVSAYGKIDILVNNAGTNIRKRPEDYSLAEWDSLMNTNLRSAFMCSNAVYPHMKQSNAGKIINIGSMLSIFGSSYASVYSTTKGGLVQLTKSLAVAWAENNIQVNVILPGWIETDLTAGLRGAIVLPQNEQIPDVADVAKGISSRIPAGRWGKPSDLSGTAIFLATSASNYVTGVSFAVDGGYSVQ